MIRCLGSLYLSWIPLVTLLQRISMSLLACYPLQRRTVYLCVCVSAQSTSLFFCLFPYNLFILYLVPRKSGTKGETKAGILQTMKYQQGSWKCCVPAQKKKSGKYSQKASQLKAGLQHDSLHTEVTMDLQKDGQEARDSPRDPETGNLLCTLHFSPKMQFIQNKALVPALKKLELGLWLQHTCG